MKTHIYAAAAVAALLAAGPAFAQMPAPEDIIKMSDANGDGAVQKTEASQWPEGMFDRADANKDGKVTLEEIKALMAAGPPR